MQDDDRPVDRETWRHLLERGAGEPPRATDERIRAEARRALAPRTGSWWLPASLAASLLLAVLVVQRQYEETGMPAPLGESDVAPAAGDAAEPVDGLRDQAVPPADMAPPAALPAIELPPLPAAAPAGKAAAAERPAGQQPPGNLEATGRPALTADQAQLESRSPVSPAAQPMESRFREEEADRAKTPEQWYAEIEALRAAGQEEEAQAELARLEEAYPGWLEAHRREQR